MILSKQKVYACINNNNQALFEENKDKNLLSYQHHQNHHYHQHSFIQQNQYHTITSIHQYKMQYIYQKVSSTYNWLSDYYYGKQQTQLNQINMTKQDKIIALRKVLKQKNMFSQQISGKIQMQFTKLIQTYQQSTFTINKPKQYPIPFPNKQEDSQSTKMQQQTKTITFTTQTILQSDKIKCPLTINCLLEQTYPLTYPKIYIDYPTLPTKLQTGQIINITSIPNPQFVSIVTKPNQMKIYKYKARTGGIQVVFNINKKQDKMVTIKQLIDESNQIMKGEFPFLKSKSKIKTINQQTNMDQQTNNIYQISKNLKNCLLIAKQVDHIQKRTQQSKQQSDKQIILPVDILSRGQQLDILLKSINSELNYQTQQNHKLLNVIKTMQQQADHMQIKQNLSQYYPIVDQSSQQMYDVLVDYQATKDCLVQIQSQLRLPNLSSNSKMFSSDQLQNMLDTYQLFNQKVFYQRIKINQIIKKQQQQQFK